MLSNNYLFCFISFILFSRSSLEIDFPFLSRLFQRKSALSVKNGFCLALSGLTFGFDIYKQFQLQRKIKNNIKRILNDDIWKGYLSLFCFRVGLPKQLYFTKCFFASGRFSILSNFFPDLFRSTSFKRINDRGFLCFFL